MESQSVEKKIENTEAKKIQHNYDSVEYFPLEGEQVNEDLSEVYALGGYYLDTTTNQKSGSIQMFNKDKLVSSLSTPAILDLKW
jgi:hypothetical protein